jgi:dCMP deaminase
MSNEITGPRKDVLSWDEYFMAVAHLIAKRSKDPSTQVGACIVDQNNVIMGTGYNGWPRGIPNDSLPWARSNKNPLDNKYIYVVHAELNAIMNSVGRDLHGSRIYVSLMPCNWCAKAIIQAGIKEVVYLSDKFSDVPDFKAGKILLEKAGIKLRQFVPEHSEIVLNIDKP